MKYPKEYLDEIKTRLKVSNVVSKYVQLKKRGKEFVGLSPFKNEKTPSFTVNDEKGFFHCFSTSEHGNIFDFLMKTQNLKFGEAVKTLALQAGMRPYTFSKADEEREQALKDYTSLYSDADCLKITPSATANKVFIQYLLDRGNGNVAGETYTEYRIITTIGGSQSNYHLSTGVLNLASGTSPYRYGTQGSYLGFVTSPTTTSEVTYNIQCRVQNSKKGTMNPYGLNVSIVAMEIKG